MGSLHSVSMSKPHDDCWFGEPCAIGRPSECPKEIAAAKREKEKGAPWSPLVVQREPGGLRHYLDGKPIHCGSFLELQRVTTKSDDYGEYNVALQAGDVVRYEASILEREIHATLYADVGGHTFRAPVDEEWMRFRWPKAERR